MVHGYRYFKNCIKLTLSLRLEEKWVIGLCFRSTFFKNMHKNNNIRAILHLQLSTILGNEVNIVRWKFKFG